MALGFEVAPSCCREEADSETSAGGGDTRLWPCSLEKVIVNWLGLQACADELVECSSGGDRGGVIAGDLLA